MVKQSEIAKIAGVDISTVSRVLNCTPGISKETSERVLRIADELGYKQRIKRDKIRTVGVIVPELISQYYAELTHVIEKRIRAMEYDTLVALSDFNAENIIHNLKTMTRNNVSGIICYMLYQSNGDTENVIMSYAKSADIPIVFLSDGSKSDDTLFDHIYLNQMSGITQIVDHLISLGHEKIGFIGEYYSITRQQCYESIMKEKGLTLDPRFIKISNKRFEKGGYEQTQILLSESEIPTAIIASYDRIAIGVLNALNEANLSVPEDISVVGFDNITTDEYLPKKLTSVTNPVRNMALIATRLLFDKIHNSNEAVVQNVSLQPILIVRETTGSAKNGGK